MKHRHRWGVLNVALTLFLLALVSVGCVQVSVVDHPATPTEVQVLTITELATQEKPAVATSELAIKEEHDIAILAVDFDPPLSSLSALSAPAEITLHVAVENKGYRKETSVLVTVQLFGSGRDDLIKQETQAIESLSPGQIQVLYFRSLLPVPYRSRYRLEIGISPASGEARWTNNYKSYDIHITDAR